MNNAGELDEVRVRRTWRRAVIPYIEEQFFGNEDRLAEFDFDRLLSELPQETRALTDADAGEGLAESGERGRKPQDQGDSHIASAG